jgi:hypothetical protein
MTWASNFSVFKTGTYARTVPSGSFVDGIWSAGSPTVTNIDATIQPATSRDLVHLPEGSRINGLRKVYTATILDIDDLITIDAVDWKVIALDDHSSFAGSTAWNRAFISKTTRT